MINATKAIERARRKLGHPIINVELTDEQMTSLLKDAQEIFYLYANLTDMPISRQDKIEDTWIKQYFFALCKETLGRVRGKFGGNIPIPGTELTLDHELLFLEAEREKCFLKYVIFEDKELLKCAQTQNAVFVFYINVGNLSNQDVQMHLEKLSDKFKKPGFTNYFIPIKDGDSRVECIYPVSKELDEEGKNVIERLNDYLKEMTKETDTLGPNDCYHLYGQKVSLDLGGIGPSILIINKIDTSLNIVYLEYDSGKKIELSIEDFEKLSGVKIYKDEE